MPKVEGDPRSGDVAAAGGDAPPNVKPETGLLTAPDDIPPVHVLEAAQNQDRKETEDLLAGFDRPGRGPKKPSVERDFVDYYAKKKSGGDSGRGPSSSPPATENRLAPRQMDVSTVVKPRKRAGTPAWLAWGGAAFLMLGVGGLVAYLATADSKPRSATPGTSATTTISAAFAPEPANRDVIPPPAPADPTTTTTTPVLVTEPPPRASGRRDPHAPVPAANATGVLKEGPSTTAPSGDRKPPPREDFIRDL